VKNLDQLAQEARFNSDVKENLICAYMPFVLSCAQKVTGRYIDQNNDDEYSIAMEAFSEAIDKYDESKGSFLPFANSVIKHRIIDYYRRIKKYKDQEVSDDITDDTGHIILLDQKISSEHYFENKKNNDLVDEINTLRDELKSFSITFDDLAEISPKHKKTRLLCIRIATYIIEDKHLFITFKNSKQLPAKYIEKNLKIPQKKYDRFRKYIIAVLIIKSGDYDLISAYIRE